MSSVNKGEFRTLVCCDHWMLFRILHHNPQIFGGDHRQPRDFRESFRAMGEDKDCHASVLVDLRGDVGRLLALELAIGPSGSVPRTRAATGHMKTTLQFQLGGFGGRRGG